MIRCQSNVSCGGGRGTCDTTGTACICTNPSYSDGGDFKRSTDCSVSIPAFQALWVLNLILWTSSLIIGIVAWVLVKRRSLRSDRIEKFHIATCLVACMFALALSILELNSGSGSVAIQLETSVVYAFTHLVYWMALLAKPSSKSETSVARFAMEQTKAVMQSYFALLPLLILLLIGSAVAAIIGSTDPNLEEEVILAYFIIFTVIFLLVAYHIGISMIATRRKMENALTNSMMVSKRGSVKIRVERFFKRAKRVMATTFIICVILEIVPLVFSVCRPCWKYLWLFPPSMSLIVSMWVIRSLTLSTVFSLRTRRTIARATLDLKSEHSSAPGARSPPPPSPSSPSSLWSGRKQFFIPKMIGGTGGGISSSSSSSTVMAMLTSTQTNDADDAAQADGLARKVQKKHKHQRQQQQQKKNKKWMTVVQEADYEGTVVVSQVESSAGLSAIASLPGHGGLEESAEGGAETSFSRQETGTDEGSVTNHQTY